MKQEELLAKNDGTTLIQHLICTSKIGLFIARSFIKKEEIIEDIRIACLLHDIGKFNITFQNLIKNNIVNPSFIYHQEISWAILSNIIYNDKNLDESILSSIYWHHSNINRSVSNRDTSYKILKDFTEDEINEGIKLIKTLIGDNITYNFEDKDIPNFYVKRELANEKNILVRSIVITADRIASQLTPEEISVIIQSDDECQKLIDKLEFKIPQVPSKPLSYDDERYSNQLNCSNISRCDKTVVVKAPAGYGKTVIGLLWSAQSNKKLIWVCPRNIIAENVYYSILNELEQLKMSMSVELYLTGNRIDCTDTSIKDFESDIVVTNIDNYLYPVVRNNVAHRSFSICDKDVIFDEFHELDSDKALFSCFINTMRIRHRYTNSNTLLLSATPSIIHKYWDGLENKTVLLPDNDHHYQAAHNGIYHINIVGDIDDIKNTPIFNENWSLTIVNSISNAQLIKKYKKSDKLIHSYFLPNDRKDIINKIITMYSKNGIDPMKLPVISSPIIQASMDISFHYLYESVLSPESTMQRIGRVDRWGNYQKYNPQINIMRINNASERSAISTQYDIDLNDYWFIYLQHLNQRNMSLNELYDVYNDFNKEYEKEIKKYLDNKLINSFKELCKIEPVKYTILNKTKKGSKSSGNNVTLRSDGKSFYCVFKINNSNELTEPFQLNDLDNLSKILEEDNRTLNNVQKEFKKICNKYDYGWGIKKNFTLEKLKQYAKHSNTPYIGLNKTYDKEYGLTKNNLNIL
jgi:CRISPR-associated endonuclease/helicase Cas3